MDQHYPSAKEDKRIINRLRIFIVVLALLVVVLVVGLFIVLRSTGIAEKTRSEAVRKEKIASQASKEAFEQRKEALIQKRIAEQQQEIATQQQIIAERQRKLAVQEHLRALEQTHIARKEKSLADSAREVAFLALKEAETQRQEAIYQKEVAETEKERARISELDANRLMMLSVARSLAIQAVELSEGLKRDTAPVLAYYAYTINQENNGDLLDPDIFNALLKTSGSLMVFKEHTDAVRGLCFGDNGQIASCGDDGQVLLWAFSPGENPGFIRLKTLQTEKLFFRTVQFFNPTLLVAGTENGKFFFWRGNPANTSPEVYQSLNYRIEAIICDNKYSLIYTAGSEGIITGWNISGHAVVPIVLDSLGTEINGMDFSPHSGDLVAACENGNIVLRNTWKNEEKRIFKARKAVRSVAFSPGGNCIAAGIDDGTILLLHAGFPGNEIKEIHGRHDAPVTKLKFINDSLLVSVSYDGLIKIGSVFSDQGNSVSVNLHDSWIFDVRISPDNDWLATCDVNKNIIVFPLKPAFMAGEILKKYNTGLSVEEWNEFVGNNIPYRNLFENLPE